ncbi:MULTISPECIES: hypothetical protein [Bacillaceae]|uniref:hypothetical protein n=1 Tax=Bacillaceae TaxID=186817 RepID=UPI002FFFFDE9
MQFVYEDLLQLFPDAQGIREDFIFLTISDQANVNQPKGLFIPTSERSGELSKAIENGAIAAIWEKGKALPHYTPNHFPVFFVNDVVEAMMSLLQCYIDKVNGETDIKMGITNFIISNKELLNKKIETYDIAVMLKKINDIQNNLMERRG